MLLTVVWHFGVYPRSDCLKNMITPQKLNASCCNFYTGIFSTSKSILGRVWLLYWVQPFWTVKLTTYKSNCLVNVIWINVSCQCDMNLSSSSTVVCLQLDRKLQIQFVFLLVIQFVILLVPNLVKCFIEIHNISMCFSPYILFMTSVTNSSSSSHMTLGCGSYAGDCKSMPVAYYDSWCYWSLYMLYDLAAYVCMSVILGDIWISSWMLYISHLFYKIGTFAVFHIDGTSPVL